MVFVVRSGSRRPLGRLFSSGGGAPIESSAEQDDLHLLSEHIMQSWKTIIPASLITGPQQCRLRFSLFIKIYACPNGHVPEASKMKVEQIRNDIVHTIDKRYKMSYFFSKT